MSLGNPCCSCSGVTIHGAHIVIIIIIITLMHGIYNYVSETNHVFRVCSVATILYLQFVLHVMLSRPWNMFCTFTVAALSAVRGMCAMPNMAVFCSSLISCSPGVLLRYCLSDFEMAPDAPIAYLYHFCFHSLHYYYYYYYCKIFTRNYLFPKITGAVKNHIFSCYLLTLTSYLCRFLYLYFCLPLFFTHTHTHTHTHTRARKN
jgi:hypothetical protein